MAQHDPQQNKAIFRTAFDTLINNRDYAAAERLWSPDYIQHSSRIPPGRQGLFDVVRSRPPEFAYELGTIVAEDDLVMALGGFSGNGSGAPWVVVNIVRFENGLLAEHWDVIEDEATRATSLSELPMFGDRFPEER